MVVFTKTVTTSQLNLNVEENMPRHVVKGVLIFEVLNRIIRSVIIQFEPETRIRTSLILDEEIINFHDAVLVFVICRHICLAVL